MSLKLKVTEGQIYWKFVVRTSVSFLRRVFIFGTMIAYKMSKTQPRLAVIYQFCFVFVCLTALSVPCCPVVTCLEWTDILALLYVMFSCLLSLSHMVSWVICSIWLYRFLIFVSSLIRKLPRLISLCRMLYGKLRSNGIFRRLMKTRLIWFYERCTCHCWF